MRPINPSERSLNELARFLGLPEIEGRILFSGLSSSTQHIQVGDLFVALPGLKTHGAKFVSDAIAAGAVAVLTDSAGKELISEKIPVLVVPNPRDVMGDIASWFYSAPFRSLFATGITGTNGKTTVTYLIEAIIHAAFRLSLSSNRNTYPTGIRNLRITASR